MAKRIVRTPEEIIRYCNLLLEKHGQVARIKEFHTKRILLETGQLFEGNSAACLLKRIQNRDTITYLDNFDKIYLENDGSITKEIRRSINSRILSSIRN